MKTSKFVELMWLRKNKDKLNAEEIKRLENVNAFKYAESENINLPLIEFVYLLHELETTVGKYLID